MIHASKFKILVSGSLAYDRIMDFPGYFKDQILPDQIHNLNISFCVNDLKENFGGCAGNIAYNLKLLGEEPVILSQAGQDFSKYEKWLQNNRINSSWIQVFKNEPTAGAYIITDQNDNQITGFYPGAMRYPIRPELKPFASKRNQLLAIVAPGNLQTMVYLVEQFKKLKIPYLFDPGQQIPVLTKNNLISMIKGAKVFISNDYELAMVLKKTGLAREKILNMVELLITTLGPKGSVIATKTKRVKIPIAYPKNTSDPTGAGDAYRAGIIRGLTQNYSLEKMGRLAALVSAYTVEKYGTQTHSFSWPSLMKRYYQNFKEKL